jgi:peptidylprolyl isomerase
MIKKIKSFSKCLPKAPFFLILLALFMSSNENATAATQDNKLPQGVSSENVMIIELKYGKVLVELMPKVAPKHVERIKTLVNQGFYDGIVFHRVIDGFMAQTGDPTGTGMGGSKLPDIVAEFSTNPHIRGVLSMARAQSPNSANSQFFIVTQDSLFLDRQYSVFGRVISGMEFVDKIKKGTGGNGQVTNPDKMIKVSMYKH